MIPTWQLAVALTGVQVVIAVVSLAAICLPLMNHFALWVHRKRVALLAAGVLASIVPLIIFGEAFTELDFGRVVPRLGTSFVWLVAQVLLYVAEDRREDDLRRNRNSRLRGSRELR